MHRTSVHEADITRLLGPLGRIFLLAALVFFYYAGAALALFEARTDAAEACATFGVPLLIAWWAERDARRSGYWPAFHYGLFLVVFAPVLAPHYALRTRGRRGLGLALALLAAVLAPLLGWGLGLLLWPWVWGLPEG